MSLSAVLALLRIFFYSVVGLLYTLINSILSWVYSPRGYYGIKSGFYIDYYLKILAFWLHRELILLASASISDKFLLSKFFKKLYESFTVFNNYILSLRLVHFSYLLRYTLTALIVIIFIVILLF